MHRRNLALALIALLAALPLTACSGKLPDPATAVRAATENASEAKTVRFEMTNEIEGEDTGLDGPLKGAVDLESHHMVLSATLDGQDFEWRILGDTSYIRLAQEQWFEMPSGLGADMFGSLLQFDPEDPFSPLNDFGASSEHLDRVGRDDVRGHATTKYAATVAGSELDGDGPWDLVTDEVTFEVWIDDNSLPARIHMAYEVDWGLDSEGPTSIDFMIEYFDWGQPVEIEAPPADQIMDLDDDLFGGGSDPTADYFAGADCYGDRVDDCLAANAELDAKAADPTLCQGAEGRICLVPIGNVRADVVDAIVNFHKDTANIDVLVLPSLALDPASIHRDTSQVDADLLYEMLQEHYGVGDLTPSTFIGITPIDVRPRDGEYGWMFGSRWGRDANGLHNHGVFSYFRMVHVEPYDGSPITDELVHLRASKYVGRYVALLYLDYPYTDDIEYLNYSDMYGFSDLDGIGTTWPTGDKPCEGDTPVICIVPDGDYLDFAFEDDVRLAIKELSAELGVRIEMRKYAGYYMPSLDDWGDEFGGDLRETFPSLLAKVNVTVIGITDDEFAQGASVSPHLDRAWPAERLAVVSAAGAGEAGTTRHEDRVKALLLRAIAQAHYDKPLNSDPSSLLFEGATKPADLDGKTAPTLP